MAFAKCSKGVEGEGQGFGCNPTPLPILGCRSCPFLPGLVCPCFIAPHCGQEAKVWFAPWAEGIPVCTFCAETAQRLILQEPGSDRDVASLDTNHRHRGVSLSGRKRRRPTNFPWLETQFAEHTVRQSAQDSTTGCNHNMGFSMQPLDNSGAIPPSRGRWCLSFDWLPSLRHAGCSQDPGERRGRWNHAEKVFRFSLVAFSVLSGFPWSGLQPWMSHHTFGTPLRWDDATAHWFGLLVRWVEVPGR